jgi:hypothetical protein
MEPAIVKSFEAKRAGRLAVTCGRGWVAIVEFESEEALQEWRHHPEHAKVKRRGIQSFFSDYKFQICTVIRDRVWTGARSIAKSQAVADLSAEVRDGRPHRSATANE